MIDNPKKVFLYLYPISEYFEDVIENGSHLWFNHTHPYPEYDPSGMSAKEIVALEERMVEDRGREFESFQPSFRGMYQTTLNQCIEQRYRQQAYQVNFLLFKDHCISDLVQVNPEDRILFADIDFKMHTTSQSQLELGPNVVQYGAKRILYPNPDLVLDQLGSVSELRVAGFHIWDCVEKMAKRAYERGIPTLVYEDLTELLSHNMANPSFKTHHYPSFNPHLHPRGEIFFRLFMEGRRDIPWLWQDY
jgi:hypothetical protein